MKENILRIFVPHDMLIQPSGLILGSWSTDKSVACVTCLEHPSRVKKTISGTNLVTLGLWRNTFNDRISHFNVSSEFDHFMDKSPTKWFLLEKQNAGLPVCTLSHGNPVFDNVIVIIYDVRKLQSSHYLTDSAHTSSLGNGLACHGSKETNVDQLTFMLMKHRNVHPPESFLTTTTTTCLATGHNSVLHALTSIVGNTLYCILKLFYTITKILFVNRYVQITTSDSFVIFIKYHYIILFISHKVVSQAAKKKSLHFRDFYSFVKGFSRTL